jgi:aspartokinase
MNFLLTLKTYVVAVLMPCEGFGLLTGALLMHLSIKGEIFFRVRFSMTVSTNLLKQESKYGERASRASRRSMTGKRPRVLLHYAINDFCDDSSKSLILHEVKRWIDEGYNALLFLACENCTKELCCWDRLKNGFALSEKHLDSSERALLCFSSSIISATTLSHVLKSEGIISEVRTGLSGGLRFKGSGPDLSVAFNGKTLWKALDRSQAVILAGMLGRDGKGAFLPLHHSFHRDFARALAETLGINMVRSASGAVDRALEMEQGAPIKFNLRGGGRISKIPDLSNGRPLEKRRVATGISVVPRVEEFSVDFNYLEDGDARRNRLLDALGSHSISLDMINISYSDLHFIVNENCSRTVQEILGAENLRFRSKGELAKLSINGIGMKGTPGVMARIYKSLERVSVEVMRSTDSHITISCLVNEDDLPVAMRALINEFALESKDVLFDSPQALREGMTC